MLSLRDWFLMRSRANGGNTYCSIKPIIYGKIFKRSRQKGRKGHAREKKGNIEERSQREESDQPETSDRDRVVGSPKRREKSPQKRGEEKVCTQKIKQKEIIPPEEIPYAEESRQEEDRQETVMTLA